MFNNIVMWRLEDNFETRNKVKAVMQAAGCGGLAPKLDEQVGERGMRLSGGEKQRLAIARELLKNPKLLILDEATSALDSHSEEIIQQSINKIRGKRTIMLIAHRLSTVKDCDVIYVLNQGKLIETGDFQTLYKTKNSFFRDLCDKQGVTPRPK
jgi:ABC-type multidrug transport system fused ATPase/permease subunit